MLRKPLLRSKPVKTHNKTAETKPLKNLKPGDFPAGRVVSRLATLPAERILTANMTGQISLTGGKFDLQFNKGSLKRISSNDDILFDKLNSRTRFKTNRGNIEYRNESAFSFEGDNEYGLRTLQVPKKRKKYDCRVITDFTFSRDSDEALITITIDYPKFKKNSIIYESSPFEFHLENTHPEGIQVSSDSSSVKTIYQDESSVFNIEGSVFYINRGDKTITLNLLNPSDSEDFSNLKSLSFRSTAINGRDFLFINPGGSYTPAPAKYYSGIHEQFCIELELKEN